VQGAFHRDTFDPLERGCVDDIQRARLFSDTDKNPLSVLVDDRRRSPQAILS
jgi:hypothetical protein